MLLLKARYPEGRRAAFVITDHADQTTTGNAARAGGWYIAFIVAALWQRRFLGHGLLMTKSLVPQRRASARRCRGPSTAPGAVAVLKTSTRWSSITAATNVRRSIHREPVSPQLDDPAIATLAQNCTQHRLGNQSALGNALIGRSRQHRRSAAFFEQYGRAPGLITSRTPTAKR